MNERDMPVLVGARCRDDGSHRWGRTGDEDRLDKDERARYPYAYWYRVYVCENACGARKVKRYNRNWGYMPEYSPIIYTDKDYLVPGGVDEEVLCALRQAEHDALPKSKNKGRHLHSA